MATIIKINNKTNAASQNLWLAYNPSGAPQFGHFPAVSETAVLHLLHIKGLPPRFLYYNMCPRHLQFGHYL